MELRKRQEIEHYDNLSKVSMKVHANTHRDSDVGMLKHGVFASYQFAERWVKKYVKEGDDVLDYGCGNGIHAILPAKHGARVTGIDLSGQSLKIARELAKREHVEKNVSFLNMDCEKLTFADNSFDVIFDGGTFSSLDLKKAIPELARVLKPTGKLIAIETLGHNPLTNLKRRLNNIRGIRTGWAVDHIFKIRDLDMMKNYFGKIETHFFNLLSLFAFPFLSFPRGISLLHFLEKVDKKLLTIPFLKPYAFKIVITASKPRKE